MNSFVEYATRALYSYRAIILASGFVCVAATATAVNADSTISYPASFVEWNVDYKINGCNATENSLSAAEGECDAAINGWVNNIAPQGQPPQIYVHRVTPPWSSISTAPPEWEEASQYANQQCAWTCVGVGDTLSIQEECPNGGTPGAELNDLFGDANANTCLIQYTGQAIPPPGTCPPGNQQDPRTGQCYTFSEQNAGPPNCVCAGDPIDPASGNNFESVTDYRGSGSFPLEFTRYYNSIIANQGVSPGGADQSVGTGWTSNIAAHLFVYIQVQTYAPCTDNDQTTHSGATDPNYGIVFLCAQVPGDMPGRVTIWHGDGSQDVFDGLFDGAPSGAFTTEAGSHGQLSFANGVYTYATTTGYTETYNLSGQLTQVQDKYGATHTYNYNYTTLGGVQTLSSLVIADASGRSITLTYNNGVITQMTDPAGNQYNYGYDTTPSDPGYGNLISLTYTYKANGNSSSQQVTYLYGNSAYPHALTGILDENESANPTGPQYTSWTYDSAGRASSSQHAGGQDLTTITYDGDGSADVTEATGAVRHLTFQQVNGHNQLYTSSKRCLACDSDIAQLGYDSNGHLASIQDFNGNITTYTMDATTGLELSRTEASNDSSGNPATRTIATTWCGPAAIAGNNSCITPAILPNTITELGRTTRYSYTVSNNAIIQVMKTVTDTAASPNVSRTTTMAYDGHGHVTSIDGPRNGTVDKTTLTYYSSPSAGNYDQYDLATVTAAGLTTTFSQYDANGFPIKILDPNSVERDITYDSHEKIIVDTTGVNTNMQKDIDYTYSANGLLTRYEPVDGPLYTYAYDDAHRLISLDDGQLRYKIYTYALDTQGSHTDEYIYDCGNLANCLNATPPVAGTGTYQLHHRHTVVYDNSGDDEIVDVGGAGQTTTSIHDLNGNVKTIDYPAGSNGVTIQKDYHFDALNRVDSIQDVNSDNSGGTTTFLLDDLDHLDAVTSPGGVTTQYKVDAFDETTQVQSPDSGTTSYNYGNWVSSGQVVHTDGAGDVLTYSYDGINRLIGITSTTNPGKDITYAWDNAASGYYGKGRLSSITDYTGNTTYKYDSDGNVIQKISTVQLGGTNNSYVTEYEYGTGAKDTLSLVFTPTTNASSINAGVSYTYFPAQDNQVSEIDASYVSGGNLIVYPLVTGITYEPFSDDVVSMAYGSGLTETRQYDQDYRLTGLAVSGGIMNWTYGYNPDGTVGQITDNITSNLTQTLTYDGLQRLTGATQTGGYGVETYGYQNTTTHVDMDGNRATELQGGKNYTYTYQGLNDGSNNTASDILLNFKNPNTKNFTHDAAGNALTDPGDTYIYDVLNHMVESKLTSNNSIVGQYYYNGLGQRVQKVAGGITTQFVYDEQGHLLAEFDQHGNLQRTHAYLGDRPIAFWPTGGVTTAVKYIHTDQLGTPRFMTNTSGTLVWYWHSDPFGVGNPTVITNGGTYYLGMPGQYYDPETQIYYNGARYYWPTIGRYYESDPIGLGGGINTYTYVFGNPLKYVDPLGLAPPPYIGPQLTSNDVTSAANMQNAFINSPSWQAMQPNGPSQCGSGCKQVDQGMLGLFLTPVVAYFASEEAFVTFLLDPTLETGLGLGTDEAIGYAADNAFDRLGDAEFINASVPQSPIAQWMNQQQNSQNNIICR